ncbi:MAG: Trk family potassium uptake protein [Oscillospiraceae bacterium]|nr:Trk family potassium uptake protein [Oscillospiraceae bacterium]
MNGRLLGKKFSSFQIIIAGFLAVILLGTFLLALPASSVAGEWTPVEDALFTAVSAVCVTGLVVRDTAAYWSAFGQTVILVLIQIGGLGIVSVTAFIATLSGRKISLLQRNMLLESLSAHQIGGIVKMTSFIFKVAFILELLGALAMLPVFCTEYGTSGIWMAVFHSVSAFCNAGFDIMGDRTGAFSSLTHFSDRPGILIPVCLLVISGGIGFLTWDDIAVNRFHLKKYRMQSKVILSVTAALIIIPAIIFFFCDFSAYELKNRIWLSLFQAVTPRTAGFNTADLTAMSGTGHMLTIVLMLIGGSPGSTAGGMKTTTLAVLLANADAVIHRRKSPQLFSRRIEEHIIKSAATLLMMYVFLTFTGAFMISVTDKLPFELCIFETSSAIGTVGLSLGITGSVSLISRLVLIGLMFLGRVGGLTVMFAAVSSTGVEVSQRPLERINVG